MATYYVSRQCYWPDGVEVVEVACGGSDYANADQLVAKYPGEGQEYADPREAVANAIEICRRWRADTKRRAIKVAVGATGGFTMPFDPITFREAIAWGLRTASSLARCAECGEILGKERFTLWDDPDAGEFCREYCAEQMQAEIERINTIDREGV